MKKPSTPPRLFQRFFRWFCRPHLHNAIEGDLMELYHDRIRNKGRRKADLLFMLDVLLLFRPAIIRSVQAPRIHYQNPYSMIKNYCKTGWRRLIRNKGYAVINIGGLALGMTVAIFIGLWIYDELSFNKYHKNHGSIAQIASVETDPSTAVTKGYYSVQYPIAHTMLKDYPQYFKKVLKSWWIGKHTLTTADDKFSKTGQFIEPGAPEMLSLKMLKGSYNCLTDPNAIILSQSAAIALFGNSDPMNRTIRINNQMEAKVTGVYEDIPRNSQFHEVEFYAPWDLWVSTATWIKKYVDDWDNRPFNIYAQLQPGVSMETANAAIRDMYKKNVPATLWNTMGKFDPYVLLVPMDTWHLYGEYKDGKRKEGRIVFVWLFGITGVFVLLLACINFINLSTARSEKRAKEVGVRKAIGSGKRQLVLQFLTESFLVVSLSFVVSMALVIVLSGWFNQVADKDISLPFNQPVFWLLLLGVMIVTAVTAGLYPAFYLSSFQPVKVLKGVIRSGRYTSLPRKVLVVVQFTVSVVLILGTLVIYQQIQYARNRPVGYERDNLVSIPIDDKGFAGKEGFLQNELLRSGYVSATGTASNPLTALWNTTGGYDWQGRDPNFIAEFGNIKVDYDFGKAVGWEFIAGRDYSRQFATDSTDAVIINESAARYMGMKDPVGQRFTDIDQTGAVKRSWTIIGVVKDMVMTSPYEPVSQTVFYFNNRPPSLLHIRLKPGVSKTAALAYIKTVFEKTAPSALFSYKFVDEEYATKFSQETRTGKLASIFAILSIFISCLGLSGLASFVAEQRTKEIGIRKVMGASVTRLWQMLSKDFVITVFISCLIAIPISYLLMDGWLEKYKYRTEISWWVFLVTIVSAIGITLITVSYQSLKAAKLNPVKSLRSE